jgi:Protein of unknown function (DUF3105)
MANLPARRPSRWCRVVAPLGITIVLAGCGSDDEPVGACGPMTREALDPAYLVHVVSPEEDIEYLSDPPTSGPHQPAPVVQSVEDEPLTRPVQVGVLERGDVLLQHGPDLDADQRAELEDLVGDGVVVAPNPDLPAPVVATAWLHKQTCDGVDADALREFIDDRVGKGPEG